MIFLFLFFNGSFLHFVLCTSLAYFLFFIPASILAKTCNESKKRSSLQARSHSNLSVRKPDQSEQRVVVNKKSHWGNKESDAVQDYFDKHIRLGRVPRKDECDKCKKSLAPLLDDKTWKNIKYKVYSAIQANKRKR